MDKYFEGLNPILKEYFSILSEKNIPDFIYEYVNTPEMQRIDKIGCGCGTDYTKLFNKKFFYSNLHHSIGVALIIWKFTKNKKQTLAGLFHDIATPVFKHCIDFMNGDYEKQESTESLTAKIISDSKHIMSLLKRDNILVEDVCDYHKYPIADNDTPKLSADRLEYTFIHSICSRSIWSLEDIKEFYNNLTIFKNEENIEELGFKSVGVAERFVKGASTLWLDWISNECKMTLQFIAEIMKKMKENNLVSIKDLYTLSEKEMIEKIQKCDIDSISKAFKSFRETTKVYDSDIPVLNKFCINVKTKKRYIVPLIDNGIRINDVSEKANEVIENYLNSKISKYAYLDFVF